MDNKIAKLDGEVLPDGTYVVSREDTGTKYVERIKVGKLKLRFEREKRTISYQDYSKLNMFFSNQERLAKDRRNVAVHLSGGLTVNTSEIASLELADDVRTTVKALTKDESSTRELPTKWVNLTLDLKPLSRDVPQPERWVMAKCHFREDGSLILAKDSIAEILQVRRGNGGEPIVMRDGHFIYGAEVKIEKDEKDR